MSTYSTNLKIELIGNGEQSGTWGDTTNGNLGTVLEEAIVGKATVDFATNADKTITMGNGPATSDARCLLLYLTATVIGGLTATRTLTVPAIKKTYLIDNATTQSIIISSGVGTTVTVPTGKRMMVYVDGSSVYQQFNDLVSGTSIGGSAIADTTSAQTLTNKTLTSPLLNYPTLVVPLASVIRTAYYRTATLSAASIATTNASSSVVITDNSNGAVVGDYVLIQNAVAVGGISADALNQTLLITAVSTNTITVNTGSAATSTTTGGGTPTLYYYHAATIPVATTTLIGTADTATLTNKRVTPRVNTVTSGATTTPTGDLSDMYTVTALAANTTIAAPTGTPTDGQKLIIRIVDAGVRRTTTLGVNAIATTNGSASIVITDNSNAAVVGNYVTISGVSAAIGGIPAASINTRFAITAVATNTITVLTGSTATSTATGTATASGTLSYDGYKLTWNSIYRAVGVTIPTFTTANKTIYVGCIYNSAATKWDVVAVSTQA